MANQVKRAALYLRVSTDNQTVENQRRELEAVAAAKGWEIVQTYEDAGISGSKGRDKRPSFDRMLKDATRAKYDVLMAWSVDRLGRSLVDLVAMLGELHAAGIDLFLHQQGLDTSTPSGKAMFQMLGVFSEFERSMIQARVHAGLARARAAGKRLGRPTITDGKEKAVRAHLSAGVGVMKAARLVGVGVGTAQRIKAEMAAESTRYQGD